MNELIILFVFFGWVSLMLKSSGEGFMRKIPMPPEHLRPREPGIKIIKKQLPIVRCKTCRSILARPKFPKDRIGCNV
jgi:hypothetical protein